MMNIFRNSKNITVFSKLLVQPMFGFGGGHHDIDRTQMRMRDDASGKMNNIQVITWTPMKQPEGC